MTERDPKRFFGKRERTALFLTADGKCEVCGCDLPEGWHADHVEPWARDGRTDVVNGQALCPTCNLRKGADQVFPFDKLRKWQQRFVAKFRAWTERVFLVVALPGGGKTIAALFGTREWLSVADGRQRFVVIAVPSRNLKRQWKKVAKKRFGLEMATDEFAGAYKKGMHGCVVTYSGIASDPMVFRRLCVQLDVMLICDEIHHVGESAAWGEGIREGFEGAQRILAMSGTPWRSNGGLIPFLPTDQETGDYVLHERFDWPEALTEDPPAIRLLSFHPYHGSAEYEDKRTSSLIRLDSRDKEMSDEDVARCLRGRLLEPQFCTDILRDAHNELTVLRQAKPDAAGIVVCVDIDHARRVAGWLKAVTGEEPVIAVSDDEVAPGEPVDAFGSEGATAKWIVSVRQVSEGVDIARLMVGVYLTNYTTELFFRQFIGRIARNQGTEADKEAYVFYPDHPILNGYVAGIMKLQAIAIARRETGGDDAEPGGGERIPSSLNYLGGSGADAAGLFVPMVDEQRLPPSEAQTVAQYAKRYGIPETTAARILQDQRQGLEPGAGQPGLAFDGDDGEPLEERLARERKRQNQRVGYWVRLTNRPYSHLNNDANEHVGCKVEEANEDQLKRRRIYIEQRIRAAKDAA